VAGELDWIAIIDHVTKPEVGILFLFIAVLYVYLFETM
jgi:hypothetical protein